MYIDVDGRLKQIRSRLCVWKIYFAFSEREIRVNNLEQKIKES